MRCDVRNCIENGEDGYCLSPNYLTIDANGVCEEMRLRPKEPERAPSSTPLPETKRGR